MKEFDFYYSQLPIAKKYYEGATNFQSGGIALVSALKIELADSNRRE